MSVAGSLASGFARQLCGRKLTVEELRKGEESHVEFADFSLLRPCLKIPSLELAFSEVG